MHTRDEKINYNFYYVMKNPLQWHCLWEQVNSVDANSVWKNSVLGRLSWVNSVDANSVWKNSVLGRLSGVNSVDANSVWKKLGPR